MKVKCIKNFFLRSSNDDDDYDHDYDYGDDDDDGDDIYNKLFDVSTRL